MQTVLITGASRGIGREFVRQFADDGWRVHACCREPATAEALDALARASGGRVTVHALDVDRQGSVAACAEALGEAALDVEINNAVVIGDRAAEIGTMDYDVFEATLRTNVLGPVRVAEAFLPHLLRGRQRRLVTVSSRMGSITHTQPNAMIYRTSKAAVNMAMRCAALQLAGRGVTTVLFHPGWVQTDMGGPGAAVTPADSVAGMRRVIAGLGSADNGGFFNYDGSPIEW